ncbi:MAG: hypothetical protein JST30_06050 [Armatimonadetes bacterium]|nr:hypothetical protein [Armatimonadota bacterium]
MTDGPQDKLTQAIDAAFAGERAPADWRDESRFDSYKRIASRLRLGFSTPPDDVTVRAKGLFQPSRRSRPVLLSLAGRLTAGGARLAAGQSAHALFEADGVKIRLMYTQTSAGVETMGEIQADGWTVVCGDDVVVCGADGRFTFSARPEGETGLIAFSAHGSIDVPPLTELDGTERLD